MKQRIIIPILLFVAVLGTSCVSQRKIDRNYNELRPDVIRLNMTMDDYKYLGDVTIEAEYKTYFGIKKILTINGQPYDPRFTRSTHIAFGHIINLGVLQKALYKVTDTYPDADYIIPASSVDVVDHMNAGRIHKCSMKLKVYAVDKISATAAAEQHKAQVDALNSQNAELQKNLEAAQNELQATKQALEKAQEEARINAARNTGNRRR